MKETVHEIKNIIKKKVLALLIVSMVAGTGSPVYAGPVVPTAVQESGIKSVGNKAKASISGIRGLVRNIGEEVKKDRSKPKITGLDDKFTVKQSKKEASDKKSKIIKPDYLENVTAEDNVDGDVTNLIKVDDSQVDYYTIGDYPAVISVEDTAGNVVTKTVWVDVTDGIAPSITIDGKSLGAKKKGDKSNFEDKIIIKDNFDDYEDIKWKIDDSKVNYKEYGKYTITVTAEDMAGNKAKKEFAVNIQDKKGPTIKVDKKSFTTNVGEVPDYGSHISIKDGSGIKESSIDDSDVNYYVPGKYKLHIRATDKKKNSSKKDVTVKVKDPNAEAAAKAEEELRRANAAMEVTVYGTRTGSKYHNGGCRHLRGSSIAMSLQDALNMGLEPCAHCH